MQEIMYPSMASFYPDLPCVIPEWILAAQETRNLMNSLMQNGN
ncbi:hypothetical protein [Legionella lansingensis]|nr:hypothetical protein [Legionella lansingensis]